jgi:hypothetical protein
MADTMHFGFSYTIPDGDGAEWDVILTLCGSEKGYATAVFSDITCKECQKAILFGAKIIEKGMRTGGE